MVKKICEDCGILISDWNRHKRGYRVKDHKGNIVHTKRCVRQHIRHSDNNPKKGITARGYSYSQGFK